MAVNHYTTQLNMRWNGGSAADQQTEVTDMAWLDRLTSRSLLACLGALVGASGLRPAVPLCARTGLHSNRRKSASGRAATVGDHRSSIAGAMAVGELAN